MPVKKKKDLNKISDALIFCNHIYNKIVNTNIEIDINKAKIKGILDIEIKECFKNLKILKQFVSNASNEFSYNKEFHYYSIDDSIDLPENIVNDYIYLMLGFDEDIYITKARSILTSFENYRYHYTTLEEYYYEDLDKLLYKTNDLVESLKQFIDKITSFIEYDRLINNKECFNDNFAKINSFRKDVYYKFSSIEYSLISITDDNKKILSDIFNDNTCIKNSSDKFFEQAISIINLLYYINLYYVIKAKIIISFININKYLIYT